MFRDDNLAESATFAWQAPQSDFAVARANRADAAFSSDETGAVWHVYREIAQRIPRKAFTRHASNLGDALR
jgi:hypothetical protein